MSKEPIKEVESQEAEKPKIDDRVRKIVMVSDGVYKCID